MITTFSRFNKIKYDIKYPQSNGAKPNGLWYSFDNIWIDFLRNAKAIDSYLHRINIDINYTGVLILKNRSDIIEFDDAFRCGHDGSSIDWSDVATRYNGIEISEFDPYFDQFYWYKTFSIKSGCIWNLQQVKEK